MGVYGAPAARAPFPDSVYHNVFFFLFNFCKQKLNFVFFQMLICKLVCENPTFKLD